MSWDSSNRRAELPRNWSSEIVPRIRARDSDHCRQCGSTQRPEVDHIGDPRCHEDHNLQVLCHECHAHKTAAQAAAARPTQRRPAEQHPGLA